MITHIKIKKISVLFVFSFFFFVFQNTYALHWETETEIFLTSDTSLYKRLEFIINPDNPSSPDASMFLDRSNILLLADGFGEGMLLPEKMSLIVPQTTMIHKTDIFCPENLDGQRKGNIFYRIVDNSKTLPYVDGFFDMVVMRAGLCPPHGFCGSSKNLKDRKTCGGILLDDRDPVRFLREIIRVLSKDKASYAYLHANKFFPYLQESYRSIWKAAIGSVLSDFVIKMVYQAEYEEIIHQIMNSNDSEKEILSLLDLGDNLIFFGIAIESKKK